MDLKEIEERMAEMHGQQKAVEEKMSALYKDKDGFDKELRELKKQYVLQSDAISEGIWEINMGYRFNAFSLCSTTKKHPKFSELMQEGYHCTIDFGPGIELHFSDWDITFCFDTMKTGLEFIKKWKVKTNIDALKKEKRDLEERAKGLAEFIEMYDKKENETAFEKYTAGLISHLHT